MNNASGKHSPVSVSAPFRSLVRGAFLSAFSVVVSMAALLVTSKLFTNALAPETVGIFALLQVASDFIIYASGLGLSASMPKLVAGVDRSEQRRIIGGALAGQMAILLGLSAATLLFQAWIHDPGIVSNHPGWLGLHAFLHLLPLLFVVGCLRDLVLAMLAGLDRYGWRAGGIAAASIAQVATVYVFVWRMEGGLVALTLAMAGSYGFALALLWAGLGRYGLPRPDWQAYRAAVRFSAPLYLNQVMNFFNQRFDTVLVSLLAGVGNAAVYEMIKRIPVIANRVMNGLLVPYLPHISRLVASGDHSGAAIVLHHAVGLSAFFGYGAALSVAAFQNRIIVWLFNEAYLPGGAALGLLLTAASLALQSGLMAQMLIALGRNVAVPLVNMTAMILCIVLDFLLIPRYGLAGAAWAAVMGSGYSFALLAVFTHRAGVAVSAWQCLKPLLLLLVGALPLYYGEDCAWCRVAAPALFVLLCLFYGVVSPGRLISVGKALLPER